MKIDKEAFDLYAEAYAEGFNKSDSDLFSQRKKFASSYARNIFPDLGASLTAYSNYMQGKEADPDLVELGKHLRTKLINLRLKSKFNNGLAKDKNIAGKNNANDLYAQWVDNNDFVGNDAMLAHFNQTVTFSAFSSARHRLKDKGYDFKPVDNGWQVTERPQKGLTDDEMKILKTLLGKLNTGKI